jgi:hypothetical protein
MFTIAARELTGPVNAYVFAVPANNVTITDYLADYKATDATTVATVGSMVLFLANLCNAQAGGAPTGAAANALKAFQDGAHAAIIALCAPAAAGGGGGGAAPAAAAAPNVENEENIANINANLPEAGKWLYNLISAAKKKKLDDKNVEGFFASLGHTGTRVQAVASLVNSVAPFFPDSIGTAAFRDLLMDNVWTQYRNTRVTTGKVLIRLVDDFVALRILADGDPTHLAIRASADAPWDINLSYAIPDKIKAYGYIFLEAAGTPIDDWKQGSKAVDQLPNARVKGCKVVFKKYLELKNNTTDIEAANTVAALQALNLAAFFA